MKLYNIYSETAMAAIIASIFFGVWQESFSAGGWWLMSTIVVWNAAIHISNRRAF